MAAKSEPKTTATQDTDFYTGKPYLASSGNYVFKYRSYNPELARWTTEDPNGFPDGANCFSYVNNAASSFFDALGFSRKSVLWVTLNNLFGNGYLSPSGFNYMADFNGNYTDLKSEMNLLDSQTAGTGTTTEYLSDGDLFDKHVVSSSAEFTSIANGYTKVFFITHGGLVDGNYNFLGPDGQYHQMTYFDAFWDSTSVTMLTCGNGYAPPVNQGNGSTDPVSWSDAVTDARWQTKNYLYE